MGKRNWRNVYLIGRHGERMYLECVWSMTTEDAVQAAIENPANGLDFSDRSRMTAIIEAKYKARRQHKPRLNGTYTDDDEYPPCKH